MPGIFGLITTKPREWAEPQLLQMLKVLRHESFYVTGTWIDETAGIYVGWTARENSFSDGMPVQNERGDITLVFSGEEYPEPGTAFAPGQPEPMRRPVVVTNPATGRRALFLSQLRGGSRYRAVDQSRADEIDNLTSLLTSPRFVYEHHWQTGDLVMWDQIGLLHARRAFDPYLRRILRQVSVMVSEPESALWAAAT